MSVSLFDGMQSMPADFKPKVIIRTFLDGGDMAFEYDATDTEVEGIAGKVNDVRTLLWEWFELNRLGIADEFHFNEATPNPDLKYYEIKEK